MAELMSQSNSIIPDNRHSIPDDAYDCEAQYLVFLTTAKNVARPRGPSTVRGSNMTEPLVATSIVDQSLTEAHCALPPQSAAYPCWKRRTRQREHNPTLCTQIDTAVRQAISEFRFWIAERRTASKSLGQWKWNLSTGASSCKANSSTLQDAQNYCRGPDNAIHKALSLGEVNAIPEIKGRRALTSFDRGGMVHAWAVHTQAFDGEVDTRTQALKWFHKQ